MTTQTLRNGDGKDLAIKPGESIQIVAVTGNYTASIIAGVGAPSVVATDATGGNYGPYATGAVVRLRSSALSEIDFDIGTAPEVVSDTPVMASKTLTGGIEKVTAGTTELFGVSGWGKTPTGYWRTIGSVTDGGGKAIGAGAFFTPDIQVPSTVSGVYGIQLVLANYDTGGALTVDLTKVAPADKHLASTASSLTWKSVTFSGASSAVVPAASAGVSQVSPGLLVSDFVSIRDVPRTDGGTRALFRVRSLISGGAGKTIKVLQMANNFAATWNADLGANGMQIGGINNNVDFVTTTVDGTRVIENGTVQHPVIGVIFHGGIGQTCGVAVGDSLTQGQGSAALNYLGWPQRVNMLDKGIYLQNFGSSGQKTVDSLATLKVVANTIKPRFVCMRSWSSNDGTSQANFDAAWSNFLEAADYCRRAGVIFVGMTSSLTNGFSTPSYNLWKAQNDRTLALLNSDFLKIIDIGNVVTDPANPTQILPAYNIDGAHCNDAAYIAQAAYFVGQML